MYADTLKIELERDIVGRPRVVRSLVRGVTRVMSGLTPYERPFCAYLLMGPPDTGKAHVARALARILNGREDRLVVADPRAGNPGGSGPTGPSGPTPPAGPTGPSRPTGGVPTQGTTDRCDIILVEGLEFSQQGFCDELAHAIRSGQLTESRSGCEPSPCVLILTTELCSREILEGDGRIGFKGGDEDDFDGEDDQLEEYCRREAEKRFGPQLMGQIDELLMLGGLEEHDLAEIANRRFERLNRWLTTERFRCELEPAARDFLLQRAGDRRALGARQLIRAHREYVEFPLSDLMISGAVPPGSTVKIDHEGDEHHLAFTIRPPEWMTSPTVKLPTSGVRIPVS